MQADPEFCVNLTPAGTITPGGHTVLRCVYILDGKAFRDSVGFLSLQDSDLPLMHLVQQIQASLLFWRVRLDFHIPRQPQVDMESR